MSMRKLLVGITVLAATAVPAALLVPGASAAVAAKSKPPVKLSGKVNDKGTKTATGNSIEIDQKDFSFSPTYIKIPAGATSISVTVKNLGAAQHTFTVPSEQIDKVLNPGDTATVTVTIPGPGAIAFFCRFHQSLGMQGAFFDKKGAKLISSVTAAGAAGAGAAASTPTTPTTKASSGSSGGYGY
jgi:plastocyanin